MLKKSRKIFSNTSLHNEYVLPSRNLGHSSSESLPFRCKNQSNAYYNRFRWNKSHLTSQCFWYRYHCHGTALQSIEWFGNHIKFLTNLRIFREKFLCRFSTCASRSFKTNEFFPLKRHLKNHDSSTEFHSKTASSKNTQKEIEKATCNHIKKYKSNINDLESQIINNLDSKDDVVSADLESRMRRIVDCKNAQLIKPEKVLLQNPVGGDTKHFTYVPILKTLRLMMENEDVQRLFRSYPYENGTKGYFDILDGEVIGDNQFFSTNKSALKIVLTQDLFESWIPIGTHNDRSKLIGIYMTLANLPPHIRSRAHNMKLVLLCLKEHVDEFGWNAVLHRLVSDLKELETTGISYSASSKIDTVKGSLVAVTGDNRACNWIGGFTKNFARSEYVSRYCENSLSEFRKRIICHDKIRTVQNYNDCIEKVEQSKKIVKGVKMDSPLNSLNYYHVCNPGLPPCADYDIYTGFARHDVLLATLYFIKKNWITLDLLNERLKKIELAPEIRVRPPKMKTQYISGHIEDGNKIKLLIMVYPIAMADSIKDHQDKVWRMILRLRQICDLVNSPALTSEQVKNLEDVIVDYLSLRARCFPGTSLRPKHLFVQHYPRMIRKFGPLKHLLLEGFETKHRNMRSIIRSCESYDNITDTVANVHQAIQASLNNQYSDGTIIEGLCEYNPEDVEKSFKSAMKRCTQKADHIEYFCTKIYFRGVTYKQNMHVCVGIDERGENILVCKIDAILVNEEKTNIYFIGKVKTVRYNCDIGIYEDSNLRKNANEPPLRCYPYSSLISYDPLLQSRISSNLVYITKCAPFGKTFS